MHGGNRLLGYAVNKSVIEENIAYARKTIPAFIRFKGGTPSSAELIDQTNAHLQRLVDAAEISRYDKWEEARKIIESGRFMSVTERNARRVAQGDRLISDPDYQNLRHMTEERLFGIPEDLVTGRPIYGVASNGNDPIARKYGEVKFIFKNVVRTVGTLLADDTLNVMTRLHPDTDPKKGLVAPVPLHQVTVEALAGNLAYSSTRLEDILLCATIDELRELLGIKYFEVQLHGEIGVEYIERILSKTDTILPENGQRWARSQQIPTDFTR